MIECEEEKKRTAKKENEGRVVCGEKNASGSGSWLVFIQSSLEVLRIPPIHILSCL